MTMSELARIAGVSASTVSRALADSPLVQPETKERIRELARTNGYRVNARAANLRRQEARALGLVLPVSDREGTSMDPFLLELLGAVAAEATRRQLDLLVTFAGSGSDPFRLDLVSTGRVDGLIIVGQRHRHHQLNTLADSGAPIVVWGGRLAHQNYVTVGSDNALGGRLATEHLLDRGARRVVFLGDDTCDEAQQRYGGYRLAHEARDLETDPRLHRDTALTRVGASEAIGRLLDARGQFDAIFAASDMLALGAIGELRTRGLRVPEDVLVVGYDDLQISANLSVPLTTVSQEISEGATLLVDLLMAHMGGKDIASTFTETKLVVRAST